MRISIPIAFFSLVLWMVPSDAPLPEYQGVTPTVKILPGEEELVYEVKWTFVKLGTIRLKAQPNLSAVAYIDSYDGLPYVDLHAIQYTQMDSALFSKATRSLEKQEKEWAGLDYRYDLAGNRVIVDEIRLQDPGAAPSHRAPKDTLKVTTFSFMDGLSIAYRARALVHTVATAEVPTVLYGKLGTTSFFFPGEHTTIELDAFDQPVRAIEVEGTTTVEGIFGMTGDFKGWFSDDEAAVPLKGRLKVLLGWVNVELVKWERKGWVPPV